MTQEYDRGHSDGYASGFEDGMRIGERLAKIVAQPEIDWDTWEQEFDRELETMDRYSEPLEPIIDPDFVHECYDTCQCGYNGKYSPEYDLGGEG